MYKLPLLETKNLVLSSVEREDIPRIVDLMREKSISDNTGQIPFPYSEHDAEFWLGLIKEGLEKENAYSFAIRNKNKEFLGAIGLHDRGEKTAEIGYWLGKPHWNKGYASEAALEILHFGFEYIGFEKIIGIIFPFNPASGKVLEKIGMQQEKHLKNYIEKCGEKLDAIQYSISKEFFNASL